MISDDKQAKQNALQLVKKLNRERKLKEEKKRKEIEKIDSDLRNNIEFIRQERKEMQDLISYERTKKVLDRISDHDKKKQIFSKEVESNKEFIKELYKSDMYGVFNPHKEPAKMQNSTLTELERKKQILTQKRM
jgi:hypothetical protein